METMNVIKHRQARSPLRMASLCFCSFNSPASERALCLLKRRVQENRRLAVYVYDDRAHVSRLPDIAGLRRTSPPPARRGA